MSRRPFCQIAICVLLGICIAAYGRVWWLAIVVVLLAVSAFFRGRNRKGLDTAGGMKRGMVWLQTGLMILMLLAGWQRYTGEADRQAQYLPYLEDGMRLSVQGELSRKERKGTQYGYELTSCVIGREKFNDSKQWTVRSHSQGNAVPCNRILVYSDADIASIGEVLVLNGKIELWKPAVNEGNFDEKFFYETRGIDFKMKDICLVSVHGKENRFREWLFRLKNRLTDVYLNVMGETESGIMATMVLGNKSMLDVEMKRLYQICGLSHILAISGLHISVIGMTLYRLLRRWKLRFWEAGAVAGGLMLAYGDMVGMGISVQRAILMFLLLLGAQTVGRSYDSFNALGIAAVFLLLENPRIFLDAGFQLSFAAVLGVVWLGNSWKLQENGVDIEAGSVRSAKHVKIKETIFVSTCIQLATLPLAAWYYYEIPLYAILVNLLLLPCMGVLLSMGIAGGITGLFSEGIAGILLFPCQKILACSGWICRCFSALPGAMLIVGKPKLWKLAGYYVALGLVVLNLQRKESQRSVGEAADGRELRAQGERGEKRRGRKEMESVGERNRGRKPMFAEKQICMGLILLALLLWHPKGGFELDVLDVGQGDGSFLQTTEGRTVFVDGGSSDVKKVGEYRILPFLKAKGVRRIDFWFVSHTDSDHISGLQEILQFGYPVEHLVFAEKMEKDEAFTTLAELAREQKTKVVYLREGDVLHLGNAKIQVLSPVAEGVYGDKNAASLVFSYEENGFTGIFTGDIDAAAEQKLLANWQKTAAGLRQDAASGEKNIGGFQQTAASGRIDFYKAAHHGSNGSNSEALLQEWKPAVITVSCGRNNRYGHPGEEAVERMEGAGSQVFYTMEGGQIKIGCDKEGIWVKKYK